MGRRHRAWFHLAGLADLRPSAVRWRAGSQGRASSEIAENISVLESMNLPHAEPSNFYRNVGAFAYRMPGAWEGAGPLEVMSIRESLNASSLRGDDLARGVDLISDERGESCLLSSIATTPSAIRLLLRQNFSHSGRG
jgi:hypothetical protein